MGKPLSLDSTRIRAIHPGTAAIAVRWVLAIGCCMVAIMGLPSAASAASLASPHVSSDTSKTCSVCHDPHQAATSQSIFRDIGEPKGETSLCYVCHDGSGATSDVKNGPDSFGLVSGHVLEDLIDTDTPTDLTNACSSCHSPHGNSALRPKLPAKSVNSVTVGAAGNEWCLACHNDEQDWYAKLGTYPPLAAPTLDASGYPVAGVFAGRSVYTSSTANAHVGIPSSTEPTRTTGDCLYCHNAHGSTSRYDSLNATLAPSTPSSVAQDRATGAYAALCFSCHGGGSWETSGAANIKQYVTHEAGDESSAASGGHRIKSAGGLLPVNAPVPCYDCHNPHGSSRGNKKLLSDALGGSFDTSVITGGPEGVRAFCLSCHVTSDLFGWESTSATYAAVPATATVEGLLRNGGAAGSGPGGGYNWLRLKVTPGHQRADASTSCYECHGNGYGSADSNNVHDPGSSSYSVALHTGTPSDSTIAILGTTYGPYACADCHDVDLGVEHAKPSSSNSASGCAECHPDPRSTLTPTWDRNTCAQGGCHTVSSSAPMHSEVDTDHAAPAVFCTAAGCHTASLGLAALHSTATTTVAGVTRTSCEVCHAAGVPATNDCATCHAGDPYPAASHTTSVTCDACHSVADIAAIHGDDCSTCHPAPVESMGTWNGTCEQSGCHEAPLHPTMSYNHKWDWMADEYGDDCWACHEDEGWGCTPVCHPHTYERVPPVTTSNAQASYTGTATITLTVTDSGVPGYPATGVRATYYQLNGDALHTGTTIVVSPPSSGTATDTLEFWSTDNNYNTEVHRIVRFRVTAGGGSD